MRIVIRHRDGVSFYNPSEITNISYVERCRYWGLDEDTHVHMSIDLDEWFIIINGVDRLSFKSEDAAYTAFNLLINA